MPLAQVLELKDTALEVVCTGVDREYQRSLPREDGRGETQPARPRWNPQGKGANGVQEIQVSVYA